MEFSLLLFRELLSQLSLQLRHFCGTSLLLVLSKVRDVAIELGFFLMVEGIDYSYCYITHHGKGTTHRRL